MNLAGANSFSENNDYTVYTINSNQNGQYSVVVPKNTDGPLSMLVDLNMKSDFDALISNNITKESLLEKIAQEYNKIKENNPQGILVFPMMDSNYLANAINSNDKQKMFDETKKIGGITSELYKTLTESGIDKSRINQKIMIVEKNETDTKFVDWLKGQMPNFVEGFKIQTTEPVKEENNNPFEGFNPFGTPEKVTTEIPKVEGNIEPQPVAQETNQINNTINNEAKVSETPVEVTTSEPIQPNNDIFASQEPIQPAEIVAPTEEKKEEVVVPTPESVVTETPKVEDTVEPQPINSVSLENTQVIPQPENITPPATPEPANNEPVAPSTNTIDKKSGGFANILILLVILVVVTIGSIELGKFLFNTFGAQ